MTQKDYSVLMQTIGRIQGTAYGLSNDERLSVVSEKLVVIAEVLLEIADRNAPEGQP